MQVYVIKITQQFKQLGVSLIFILARAPREPAYSNKCGSSP